MTIYQKACSIADYTVQTRRLLHQIPDLSFEEHETAHFIALEMEKFGFQVKTGVGGTGVTAVYDSALAGKNILLRFDMDALPIHEATELGYKSKNIGKMHACGHDGHMAIGLSLAKMLSENPGLVSGKVYFVFQPAEEIGQGAKAIIADGVFNELEIDYALSCHLWTEKPFGWVGISSGGLMAGSSDFSVTVFGRGGHAAKPEACIDPLLIAAEIISSLQSIVSRSLSANQNAIVSLTRIHGSDRNNIIADQVKMSGSLRWFDTETRNLLYKRVTEISEGIAKAYGASTECHFEENVIPVINNGFVAGVVLESLQRMRVDVSEVKADTHYKTMLSEDFAYFCQQVPGAMILIGAAQLIDTQNYPHHHPKFNFNEHALPLAVACLLESTIRLTKG